ncbi:MAG: aromatic acid decarboxylase [Chlamydiales bacterium]|nr:aromatic acid decarboxylase [Chlamydiales bacterium]
MGKYIVGVSGASGIVLAQKTIEALANLGHQVLLVMSQDACLTALEELGKAFSSPAKFKDTFPPEIADKITTYHIQDFTAPISSGSYYADGMVIVPCSMATLAALSIGLSDNLLRRAADVCLKEKRLLSIVPRETPVNTIHLENMLKLGKMGANIVLPIPGWYTKHQTLDEAENFIVGRILDSLKVENSLYTRWGSGR